MGVIGLRGAELSCENQGLVSVLGTTCPGVPAFVVPKQPRAVCAVKLAGEGPCLGAGKAVPVWDAMEGESPQLLLCLHSRLLLSDSGFDCPWG